MTTQQLSLTQIKSAIAESFGFTDKISASDIRELAQGFPELFEIIEGANFSKKDVWQKIYDAYVECDCDEFETELEDILLSEQELMDKIEHTHDCIDEPFTLEEIEAEINKARQKFVDEYRQKFHSESTAIVLASPQEIIHPDPTPEKSWVYFALVFLVSFIIVAVELTADSLTWLTTWAIPTLIQFSQKVYLSGKNIRSLYEQIRGMNYLFIV